MVKRVLFLSSANSVRSQMAEGFLRVLAADAFEAFSAGSVPRELDPLAVAVMAELALNFDVADEWAKGREPRGPGAAGLLASVPGVSTSLDLT